jgi:hypothetical protein
VGVGDTVGCVLLFLTAVTLPIKTRIAIIPPTIKGIWNEQLS